MTLWGWVRYVVTTLPRLPSAWYSRPSVAMQRITSFLALLRETKGYQKIGVMGYCYGGYHALRLAAPFTAGSPAVNEAASNSDAPRALVDSIVLAHPGPVFASDVRAIAVPSSWVCAEVDLFFSDAARLQAEAALTARGAACEFRVYKGTAHGFATRPNPAFADIMARYGEALEQTAGWFEKTLSVQAGDDGDDAEAGQGNAA